MVDPLNARAFTILAELAEQTGNMERAVLLSKAAMRRSLRESEAIYRLLISSFEAKDYPETLKLADVLLRTRPSTGVVVVPILAKLAETDEARDALKAILIDNPPWRELFFAKMLSHIADARTRSTCC